MFTKFVMLVLFVTASSLHASQLNSILVIGDSISAAYGINKERGWVALLQQRLNDAYPQWHVINASVSGDTSRTGLNRLPVALETHRPAILIIALGGNDGLRGLPLSELENSLSSMIMLARNQDVQVMLAGIRMPPNYGPDYNKAFASIYTQLADEYAIPLAPRLLENVAEHHELMQEDGIHPNEAGQPKILENIWAELVPLLNSPVNALEIPPDQADLSNKMANQ